MTALYRPSRRWYVRLEPEPIGAVLGHEPGSRLCLSAQVQAPMRVASFGIELGDVDASANTVAVANLTVGAMSLMARPNTILVIEPDDAGRRLELDLEVLRLPVVEALAGSLVRLELVRVSSARSPSSVRAVVRSEWLPA